MITSNPEARTRRLTKKRDFAAMLTDVFNVKLSHQVGKLQEVLSYVCKALGLNVEYMYALCPNKDNEALYYFAKF